MKHVRLIECSTIILLILSGCSLRYDEDKAPEAVVPELTLEDAKFSRTENGKITTTLSGKKIEQYKADGRIFAKDIEFEVREKDGKVSSKGSCGLLSADSKNDQYVFFDGITLENTSRNVVISADSLKWDGRSEQLTGERQKDLTIKKDGLTLTGKGFTASAISNSFAFSGAVTGTYEDKASEESDSEDLNIEDNAESMEALNEIQNTAN